MKQTIHYTVELLANGTFNIYEGDSCTQRNLRFAGLSPAGAAERVGTWVIDWYENEKAKREEELKK